MEIALPTEIEQVFQRFVTTEYTTIDRRGQPIVWPVNPYYEPGDGVISTTTGIGFPKKADDAAANPKVGLLFSNPQGSRLERPPAVLVQGTAEVDTRDFDANRERYRRESLEKFPDAFKAGMLPPVPMRRIFGWWYLTRIYIHVTPERVWAWPEGDFSREPERLGAAPAVEPGAGAASGAGAGPAEAASPGAASTAEPRWDGRIEELGRRYSSAVLSVVDADGFPFSARVPVALDRSARRIRIDGEIGGATLRAGRACLVAHDHDDGFTYMRSFQVRGELEETAGGWELVPRRLIGGFEMPPTFPLVRYSRNMRTMLRYWRTARRVLARDAG